MESTSLVIWNLVALWLAVISLFVLTIRTSTQRQTSESAGNTWRLPGEMLSPGSQAPAFKAHALEGKEVSDQDFKGSKVAFVFFSPSCMPCVRRIPEVNASLAAAQAKGIQVVIVSTEGREPTEAMVALHHPEPPVLIAPKDTNMMMHDYLILGTPTYVLVSEDGTVQESSLLTASFQGVLESWTLGGHPVPALDAGARA